MAAVPTAENDSAVTVESTDGVLLQGDLVRSEVDGANAVVLLHGFPSGDVRSDKIGGDMPELCDRVQRELGWSALTVRFRGCGDSTGNFSLSGWCDDAAAGIRHLKDALQPRSIWVVGFGTGGAVGLAAAGPMLEVAGVAIAGAPADFADWAQDPDRLLRHAREVGVIRDSSYPDDVASWSAELEAVRVDESAEQFRPRPLLVVHGTEDEAVPHFDARMIADRHASADLRVIGGGAHQLRHDPRAIAIVLGWLVRNAGG